MNHGALNVSENFSGIERYRFLLRSVWNPIYLIIKFLKNMSWIFFLLLLHILWRISRSEFLIFDRKNEMDGMWRVGGCKTGEGTGASNPCLSVLALCHTLQPSSRHTCLHHLFCGLEIFYAMDYFFEILNGFYFNVVISFHNFFFFFWVTCIFCLCKSILSVFFKGLDLDVAILWPENWGIFCYLSLSLLFWNFLDSCYWVLGL